MSITPTGGNQPTLRGWYPTAIDFGDGQTRIDWCYAGQREFAEPFFEDTIVRLIADEAPRTQSTSEELAQFSELDCLPPAGFIFHASRCGSTLVSQLLALPETVVAMSEVPVIDQALLAWHRAEDQANAQLLRDVTRTLGQKRSGVERHLVVKLDSWHIGLLPQIQAAFPEVPCIFLYRDPLAILQSHMRHRGRQMVPGQVPPELLRVQGGLDDAGWEGFTLRVVAGLFEQAIEHAQTGALTLVNYSELPGAVWTRVAGAMSIELSSSDISEMRRRALRHAKDPDQVFTEESGADIGLPERESTRALELYQELEHARAMQLDGHHS